MLDCDNTLIKINKRLNNRMSRFVILLLLYKRHENPTTFDKYSIILMVLGEKSLTSEFAANKCGNINRNITVAINTRFGGFKSFRSITTPTMNNNWLMERIVIIYGFAKN